MGQGVKAGGEASSDVFRACVNVSMARYVGLRMHDLEVFRSQNKRRMKGGEWKRCAKSGVDCERLVPKCLGGGCCAWRVGEGVLGSTGH